MYHFTTPIGPMRRIGRRDPLGSFIDGHVSQQRDIRQKFFGKEIALPLGIPAGPILNFNFAKAAFDKGFNIVVHKTVRTREYKSHPNPNILPVDIEGDLCPDRAKAGVQIKRNFNYPLSITNSFGNPSYSPDIWIEDLKKSREYARPGQTIVASIEGTYWDKSFTEDEYIEDWCLGASMVNQSGVEILELNFSCPNKGIVGGDLLCFNIERSKKIIEKIKLRHPHLKIIPKLAYFDCEFAEKWVSELGDIVDGVAVINTIQSEVRNPDGTQALLGDGRSKSGVCGASIKWAGVEMTKRMYRLREDLKKDFVIIGGGGVFALEDYKEYIQAGSDIVMSATGAMWNPYLAEDIGSHAV